MALTETDKRRLNQKQQQEVLAATSDWEKADAAGDEAGKQAAHERAERARNGAAWGYTSNDDGSFQSNIGNGTGVRTEAYSTPSEIEALQRAKKQAALAQLQSAVNRQVSGYEEQIAGLEPQYQSLRSQSEVERYKSQKALRENLANSGELTGGQGRQDTLNLQNAYASQIGALNAQQQSQTESYRRAIADAISEGDLSAAMLAAQYDAAAAEMGLSDRRDWEKFQYQKLADERDYFLQEAGLTGYLNGQSTLANRQFEESQRQYNQDYLLQEAGLTGYLNGNPTLDRDRFQEEVRNNDRDYLLQEADRTGYLNGNPTLDNQKFQFDSKVTLAELMGYLDGMPTLEREQFLEKIREFNEKNRQ